MYCSRRLWPACTNRTESTCRHWMSCLARTWHPQQPSRTLPAGCIKPRSFGYPMPCAAWPQSPRLTCLFLPLSSWWFGRYWIVSGESHSVHCRAGLSVLLRLTVDLGSAADSVKPQLPEGRISLPAPVHFGCHLGLNPLSRAHARSTDKSSFM